MIKTNMNAPTWQLEERGTSTTARGDRIEDVSEQNRIILNADVQQKGWFSLIVELHALNLAVNQQ